ncbi:histone-lysine N-methyltransferase EHMT1-like [Thalassophryne amazonica]|uniref:histone-lysine N-methyltransferase EHMT1-like n=1 Tax=Thalassophryne amazonica TaxID=390379 RepID=UPI001470FB94|nr:histone-lysine N-methyltransferase EHMT1-like [Thalassophryne amazonica]
MAHSGVSPGPGPGPGPERRSSSPFSASASCAKSREAKRSTKSKEKIIPFHITAVASSDGGLHGKPESVTSVKFQGSARNPLVDTSGSLTANSFRNRMSAGSTKERVSNSGSVQAAEEQTSPLSQPAGRKVENLMDTSKTKSPSRIRVPQRQKCKLKQASSVCSYTKPQTAMKKKKRKMGMYSLVPKKKTKVLKQQEKNVEPLDIMKQSRLAADAVIPESLHEMKSGDGMVEKNDLLMEVKLGEGCCIEYTELALDCLDLKAQEELLLPRLSDADATEKDLAEELPLCCCRMETPHSGSSLSTLDQTCMAMERVDGMLSRCHRRVIKQEMMRPSNAVHLLVLCEDHRAGMVKHQCCPGCGLFCRVVSGS